MVKDLGNILDEALDFAKKAKCPIDEAEIIRCNSTGLAIFNPQNCADYLESMKNKDVSREDKIKAQIIIQPTTNPKLGD